VVEVKVLTCGNHPKINGGITSVIAQIRAFDWKNENISMSFVPTYYGNNVILMIIGFIVAYIRIIKKILLDRVEIVHIHMSYKGSFYRAMIINNLCKKLCVKTIIHLHGSTFKNWYDGLDDKEKLRVKQLFETANATIVLGHKWKKVVSDIAPNANIFVVNNSVEIPEKTVDWNNSHFGILFMGVLIESIKLLRDLNQIGNMKLTIAGSGKEENRLIGLVNKYNLSQYVEFAGWVSGKDKEKYYRDNQLFVLPSYNEGLPMSILEAMSFGMPIIATDVGDVSCAVDENGFLIKPGDIKGLSDRILKIYSSKHLFITMSKKSRELAIKNFSNSQFFNELRTIYFNI